VESVSKNVVNKWCTFGEHLPIIIVTITIVVLELQGKKPAKNREKASIC